MIALAEVLRGGDTSYVSMADVDLYLGSEMLSLTEGEDGRTYAHFIAPVGEAAVEVNSKEIFTEEELDEIFV